MKRQERFAALFQKEAKALVPDQGRKEKAMEIICQEVSAKDTHRKHSLWELAVVELQYISPLFWCLQGFSLAALLLLLRWFPADQSALTDYLKWGSVEAAWLGVLLCGSLGKHFSGGMAELEQSCYFNLLQMWTIQMILVGIVDFIMLSLYCGGIAENTGTPFGQVGLYLLVPFVLSNVCCLLLFTARRGGRNRYGQLALAVLAGTLAWIPERIPEIYTPRLLWVWILLLWAGTMLLVWQIRLMYGKIRRGEMLCWN